MDNWIEKLNVGDKVLIGDSQYPVKAIHKLHIVTATGKYKKSNGCPAGEWTYGREYLREATPERIAEIAEKEARGKLLRRIVDQSFRMCSTETLQKIVALLDAEKDGENAAS